MISLKNSNIPQRNQGIDNGVLGVTLIVVLDRSGMRCDRIGEGVSSFQGVKPVKTGESGL
jgi:hypothetical protein